MALQPGTLILKGKYRVESLAGHGAFGEVYHVIHLQLNQPRAVKILRRDMNGIGSTKFDEYRTDFQNETRLGARLNHPNIIKVYDCEEIDGELYLIMEDAVESLADRLEKQGKLTVEETIRLTLDVCDGLTELYDRLHAVHRDIKPSNILLGADGRWKIADLGFAQLPEGHSSRSERGSMAPPQPGTDLYMSPEQSQRGYLSQSSDVYSLGCVVFECLTGQRWKEIMSAVDHVRDLRHDVPKWFDAIVARMLCLTPGISKSDVNDSTKRYATTAALSDAIRQRREGRRIPLPLIPLGIFTFSVWILLCFLVADINGLPPTLPLIAFSFPTTTSTATLTPAPTYTPTSTLTPTSTSRSTSTPTFTPTSTSTPTLTPTPTKTPSPTPTRIPPTPTYAAPVLVAPPNNANVSQQIDFGWTWDRDLKPDESFDVLVWPESQQPSSIANAKDKTLSVNLRTWQYASVSGKFLWTIRVRSDTGPWLSQGSQPSVFYVGGAPGPGPGPNQPKTPYTGLLREAPSSFQVLGTGSLFGGGMILGLYLLTDWPLWPFTRKKRK